MDISRRDSSRLCGLKHAVDGRMLLFVPPGLGMSTEGGTGVVVEIHGDNVICLRGRERHVLIGCLGHLKLLSVFLQVSSAVFRF